MRTLYGLLGVLLMGAHFALTNYLVPAGTVPEFKAQLGEVELTYTVLNGLGLGFLCAWMIMYCFDRPVSLGGVLGAGLCALYFVLVTPKVAEGALGVTAAVALCYLLGKVIPHKPADSAQAPKQA
jgi:hypothetical protein